MFYKLLIILIYCIESKLIKCLKVDWSDLNLTTPQLIESRNFKSETHYITTSDGYILPIFRIINPYLRKKLGKPIVVQHGFLSIPDEFLIARKGFLNKNGSYVEMGHIITDCSQNFGNTLGFVLSACGYDVWLSNLRGNKYAKNHTSLNSRDFQFWKFTLDQYSQKDLPAVINYVKFKTKSIRIGYIGYSMGTTLMFQLMSAQPLYSSLIDPFIALAPIVYISKIPSLFLPFKYLYSLFRKFPKPLLRTKWLKRILAKLFIDQEQSNYVRKMSAHLLDESSTLVLSHFLQIMAKNKFTRFDWGLKDNFKFYGRAEPLEYPLEKIASKRIALIQSKENDIFSDFKDISRLKRQLKVKLLLDYWIPVKNWTHSDYLYNHRLDKYVISVVMKLLNQ